MPAPAEAICQEVAWKSPELRRFCVALVTAAMASKEADFTTDLVTDADRTVATDAPGSGIAGSAITVLKAASVLKAVGITQNGTFYAARRMSERPGTKSRYVGVYQLTSREIAGAFLKRNQITAPTQPELVTA